VTWLSEVELEPSLASESLNFRLPVTTDSGMTASVVAAYGLALSVPARDVTPGLFQL
jgi:hypothetical protein